jgi:hypothetical protein
MSGYEWRGRLLPVVAAFAAPALYGLLVRPRLLTWGATGDEASAAYPGDGLVPEPDGGATMATTFPAPPEMVWPWLAQMGGHRAGWYSWDWLDNNGERSAARIVPEWQSLEEGQHLNRVAAPKWQHAGGDETEGQNRWTVAIVDPNRTLVLQTSYAVPSGQGFDPWSGPIPRAYVEGIWGFHLRPAPGGRTRLVTRTPSRDRPRAGTRLLSVLVGEPVHFIMQTRQFHNLRTRVRGGGVTTAQSKGRDRPSAIWRHAESSEPLRVASRARPNGSGSRRPSLSLRGEAVAETRRPASAGGGNGSISMMAVAFRPPLRPLRPPIGGCGASSGCASR